MTSKYRTAWIDAIITIMHYEKVPAQEWYKEVIQAITDVKYETWIKDKGEFDNNLFEGSSLIRRYYILINQMAKQPDKSLPALMRLTNDTSYARTRPAMLIIMIPKIAKNLNATVGPLLEKSTGINIAHKTRELEPLSLTEWCHILTPFDITKAIIDDIAKNGPEGAHIMSILEVILRDRVPQVSRDSLAMTYKLLTTMYDEPSFTMPDTCRSARFVAIALLQRTRAAAHLALLISRKCLILFHYISFHLPVFKITEVRETFKVLKLKFPVDFHFKTIKDSFINETFRIKPQEDLTKPEKRPREEEPEKL